MPGRFRLGRIGLDAGTGVPGTVRFDPADESFADRVGSVTAVTSGTVGGRPVVVAASRESDVGVYSPGTGELERVLGGHEKPVSAVATGRWNGRPVVVTGTVPFDWVLRVFDRATGRLLHRLDVQTASSAPSTRDLKAVGIAELGGHCLLTAITGPSVFVYDLTDGTELPTVIPPARGRQMDAESRAVFEAHQPRPIAASTYRVGTSDVTLALSKHPDHRVVAAAFDPHTGRRTAVLATSDQPEHVRPLDPCVVHVLDAADGVTRTRFGAPARVIHGLHVLRVAGRDLIACGAEGSVTVHDAADGAQRYRLLEGGWAPVSADVGGRTLLAHISPRGDVVFLHDLETAEKIGMLALGPRRARPPVAERRLAFVRQGGRQLLLAAVEPGRRGDGDVQAWDAGTWTETDPPDDAPAAFRRTTRLDGGPVHARGAGDRVVVEADTGDPLTVPLPYKKPERVHVEPLPGGAFALGTPDGLCVLDLTSTDRLTPT